MEVLDWYHEVEYLLASEEVKRALGYLGEHRERNDRLRRAGYPIGSGVVESRCKLVVEARLKQAGMRWKEEGAQRILALRGELLSNRWEEVWSHLWSTTSTRK